MTQFDVRLDKAQAMYVDHMDRLERSDCPLAKKAHIDNPVCFLLLMSSSFMSLGRSQAYKIQWEQWPWTHKEFYVLEHLVEDYH